MCHVSTSGTLPAGTYWILRFGSWGTATLDLSASNACAVFECSSGCKIVASAPCAPFRMWLSGTF